MPNSSNVQDLKTILPMLKQVVRNNSVRTGRDWYNQNRENYQSKLKQPLMALCQELGERLQAFDKSIYLNPAKNIYRLHRDLRFTKDHRPFKEWASFYIWRGTPSEKKARPGYYLHIEPEFIYIGAGKWSFTNTELKQFRETLANPSLARRLEHIVQKTPKGYEWKEYDLKTPPAIWASQTVFPDALKWKGLAAGKTLDISWMKNPRFKSSAIAICKQLIPINDWLDESSQTKETHPLMASSVDYVAFRKKYAILSPEEFS